MNIKDTIEIAIKQRPKFGEAIGYSPDSKLNTKDIPPLLSSIYALANGTYHSIDDQSLMDIVPGFRLIHRDELKNEFISFSNTYNDLNNHIPFLGDYGSSYYSLNETFARITQRTS